MEDVRLSLAEGEMVSVVGPSGCGKSTLLRCIAGLLPPTGGQVELSGTPVNGVPDGLSVVFQDYSRSLYPWLTVQDNVALPLRRTERSRKARRAAADAALGAIGLPGVGKVPVAAVRRYAAAGGDRPGAGRRPGPAADGRAVRLGRRADPGRPGGPHLRVRSGGITILLVTHDIDESVYVGDRVIVLTPGPGRILADLRVDLPAPRDQISTKQRPEFVQLRTEVSRLIRSLPDGREPSGTGGSPQAATATGPASTP